MVGRLRNVTLIGGLAVCAGLSSAPAVAAQGGASGPIVRREVRHDRSPRLSDMKPLTSNNRRNGYDPDEEGLSLLPPQGRVKASRSSATNQPDPVVQTSVGPEVAATLGLNFKGVVSANGYPCPDANGAVGVTQYVQWVNTRFAVYSKTSGTKLLGPMEGSTLWQGFGGACDPNANPGAGSNQGDIIAQYDKAAGRWVMTHHAQMPGNPFYQCVAVSTTSDATGIWNRYAFRLNLGSDLPDYPKLGVWSDAYYMSWDVQAVPGFQSVFEMVCALDRNAMLSGASATSVCFHTPDATYIVLLPSDLDGQTAPPTGSPEYYLSLDPNRASLDMWQFHVDFGTPSNSTFTGPTNIPVAPFTPACPSRSGVCIPQLGTTQVLDSLSDRLMYRLAYRNFGSHESLVVAHSVNPPTSAYAGIRWYEIRSPETTPVVYQQGTYSPNDGTSRWLPSIAMDKVGDIAVGYSVSSSSIYPGIRYTGRVPTDALNTLAGESTIITGTGAQTTGNNRWGDYSALSVDPLNDCAFWYTNEYYVTSGTKNWFTRIASFKFPNCH